MTTFSDIVANWQLEDYKGNEYIEDIFDWLWDKNETYHYAKQSLKYSGKSEDEADRLRMKGNHYFKIKNFEKALEFYNLSIMAAPHPVLNEEDTSILNVTTDEDDKYAFPRIDPVRYGGVAKGESQALAQGFANRSAIMFELHLYEKCLQDINLALEYGYPDGLLIKLEGRKQRCIEAQQAIVSSDKSKLNTRKEGHQNKPNSDFVSLLSNMMDLIQPGQSKQNQSLEQRLCAKPRRLPKLSEPNEEVPSLSTAVKISYKPLEGRGIVATRDIRPGEVIGVERAVFVGIGQEKLATYCSTCTDYCLTPLPCPGCSQVIFCSKPCRTGGLAEDHWYDCKILSSMNSLELVCKTNAYKMLKTFTCQKLKAIEKELQSDKHDDPKYLGFTNKGIHSSTSYQTVYHLSEGRMEYPPGTLLAEGVLAFTIAKFLELSGRYFVDDAGVPVTATREEFLDTCKLLYFNGIKKRINSSNIIENKTKGDFVMCLAMSLVNHSCWASAGSFNYGRTNILLATRTIAAGEEVKINYRYPFERAGKEMRQESLKDYDFVCRCEACEGNWPTYQNMQFTKFKCINCLVPQLDGIIVCYDCELLMRRKANSRKRVWVKHQKQRLSLALKEIQGFRVKLLSHDSYSKQDLQSLCETTELIQKHSAMPCMVIILLKCMYTSLALKGSLWAI